MGLRPMVLRGGRVASASAAPPEKLDIAIGADGRIVELAPRIEAGPGAKVIDLAGKLVVPGLVDAHQHLDKARTRRAVPNPDGTLPGAIDAFRRYAAGITRDDVVTRGEQTVEACLARGTVAIRTHANVDPELRNRAVEALVELRGRWKDRMRLQIVAFLTSGATRIGEVARQWLDEAIAAGADVIGGTPAVSDDPESFLDLLFDAAVRHGRPLDLHLDEHLNATRHWFEAVIARTRKHGMQGRVTAGHCSALSALPPEEARRIIADLAEARIAVITLPAANLFLQGRDAPMLPPRGLTRVRELMAAGVKVAAASDNIQDPFVPVGTGDLLEIARWTLLAGHLGSNELSVAFDMVSRIPANIMGLDDHGIRPGARADLLIVDAEDVEDLVASGPPVRTVLNGGWLVAGTL